MSGQSRLLVLTESERYVLEAGPRLREPQKRAIRAFVEMLKRLPGPLADCTGAEVAGLVRSLTNVATSPDVPRIEFAMATGTGKTKVIGTIASLLFVANEVDVILLLGSTRAVVERLRRDLAPGALDPLLASGELQLSVRDVSDLVTTGIPAEFDGPAIAVMTIQGLQASLEGYAATGVPHPLAGRRLVAFFDEAHHLADGIAAERWSFNSAVSALSPSLVVGTTGTPRDGTPILYEYSLAQSLRDGLYSKVPIIWLEPTWTGTDDEAVIQRLQVGLERLDSKRRALETFETRSGLRAEGTPMMLVCAASVEEARRMRRLLTGPLGIPQQQVLSVDTRAEAGLSEALEAGKQRDQVKVVVQVRMLDEGWDVANIYVILVERAGASWTNARQVMGRGLRLPFGHRLGTPDRELDELDVMAFGGSAFERVREEIRGDFGYAPSPQGAIGIGLRSVRDAQVGYAETPLLDFIQLVQVPAPSIPLSAPLWPPVEITAEELVPDDDVISGLSRPLFGVVLGGDQVGLRRMSRPLLDETDFASDVALEFVRRVPMLDAPVALRLAHDATLRVRAAPSFPTRALPSRLAQAMAERVVRKWAQQPLDFLVAGTSPLSPEVPLPEQIPVAEATSGWAGESMLYRGWKRSVYDAAPFDVVGEFDAAGALDESPLVDWWLRNDPYQLAIWWAGGRYHPDFIAQVAGSSVRIRLLIEVKRSDEMDGGLSDAALKKRAALRWCQAASDSPDGYEYRYHVIASEAGAGGLAGILEGLARG